MRNLKKFLALVLAMMMALSLMVTANAQNAKKEYQDVDEAEFTEAIDVLTGMGVLKGNGGDFRPTETITRAEAAAVLYRLVTGDVEDKQVELYAPQAYQFSDVTPDKWYDGYVGFAVDAGFVKGYDGQFMGERKVTGYEMLAMLLRAVGYGKNGEFTGDAWRINVGATAQQLGILETIKSTHYASTLSQGSAREVVAELTFVTATKVPTVTWTMLGGYNEYATILQDGGKNPTLGEKVFGLTSNVGIVVGNQATGEDDTLVGSMAEIKYKPADTEFTAKPTGYEYKGDKVKGKDAGGTEDTGDGTEVETFAYDLKTGLGLFGHKVQVWHNGNGHAYAAFDRAELSATVGASDVSKFESANKSDGKLAQAAADAGFKLPDSAAAFYESASFSRIAAKEASATPTKSDKSGVYILISNNGNKTVDVVIPVEVTAAEIVKVNNWASTKTITLDTKFDAGKVDTVDDSSVDIKQDDIMSGTDNLAADTKVIATCVTKNTKGNDTPVYWLDKVPAPTVTGKVVKYAADQTVTLDNGESYERTIIADTAISNNTRNYDVKRITTFENATYKFTLDAQGNWLHAEKLFENNFIYGTYIDYTTTMGSGEFSYTMVGIDLNGQQTTTNPTSYRIANDADATELDGENPINGLEIPYHGQTVGSGLDTKDVGYKGFIIEGKLVDSSPKTLYNVAGFQTMAGSEGMDLMNGDVDFESTKSTTIGKSDITLSVAKVETEDGDLYLTEQTKFIVVEGYGTASAKAVIYNGISGLLGGSKNVTIATGYPAVEADAENGVEAKEAAGNTEILISTSPYVYANSTDAAVRQVNTMILPKSALKYGSDSSLYFFHGDGSEIKSSVVDTASGAHLFAGYQGDQEVSVWISAANVKDQELYVGGNTTKLDPDKFVRLVDTGKEAADGKPIYKTEALEDGENEAPHTVNAVCYDTAKEYVATTNNGHTAMLGDKLMNIANAKVVNLVPDDVTIKSMGDLNNVSSVYKIEVCVVYSNGNPLALDYIYVVNAEAPAAVEP